MPTPTEFQDAAAELQKLARRYHRFEQNPDAFLKAVHQMGERLRAYGESKEKEITGKIDGVEQIRPVNFLRHVIVDRMLDGEGVTVADLSHIKDAIDERRADYFTGYPELQEEIAYQKERKRSSFHVWDTFRVLFGIDYFDRGAEVERRLETIAQFLKNELGLDDCKYHLAGFDHNYGFGTSLCWVALYPAALGNHQDAHQIFLGIWHDHYAPGLIAGERVGVERKDLDIVPATETVDTGMVLKSYRERLSQFRRLNQTLIDKAEVKHVVNSIFSNEHARDACLELFLQSIKEAHRHGNMKWAVHAESDRVRLVSGRLVTATLCRNSIWLPLDDGFMESSEVIRQQLDRSDAWTWDEGDFHEYRAVPSVNGYYHPAQDPEQELRAVVAAQHHVFIERVAQKYEELNAASRKKHNPAVLAYLSSETGRTVPRPGYSTSNTAIDDLKQHESEFKKLPSTEKTSVIQSRIGQGYFRDQLIGLWSRCAVTGCEATELLLASHIKPWRESTNRERLDPFNGLLLTPNLDSVFDKGFITFTDEGQIRISDRLSEADLHVLAISPDMTLSNVHEENKPYLQHHRDVIFGAP